jgi:hypothetical protein
MLWVDVHEHGICQQSIYVPSPGSAIGKHAVPDARDRLHFHVTSAYHLRAGTMCTQVLSALCLLRRLF